MKTVNVDSDTQIKVAVCRPAVRNALRRSGIFRNRKMSLALIAPPGSALQDYVDALKAELGSAGLRKDVKIAVYAAATRKMEWAWDDINVALSDAQGVVVVIPHDAVIPAQTEVALDAEIHIGPIRPTHLSAAIRRVFDVNASTDQARTLLTFERDMMLRALRPARPIETVIERLNHTKLPPPRAVRAIPIDDLAGYGAAKDWATDLAVDIKDWSAGLIGWADVDCGLLLSGPPGSGKTMFAAAVALGCDMSLVKASAAQWQAEGHLGDYLKAMRRSFKNAAEKAPCILFIDEFDSVGDRTQFSGDNASYMTQVVNGLLELLDGAERREGVVVVASTNYPDRIDPALRRPGRLDRHIGIELPDLDARKVILTQHLGTDFSVRENADIAARTAGYSGADLAQLARDAKRIARRERREITAGDVLSIVPPSIVSTDEERWLSCIHESGHAVVGMELNFGEIELVVVRNTIAVKDGNSGHVLWKRRRGIHRTRQSYANEIAMLLAGRAAEEVIARDWTDGSGGAVGSDLELASTLATLMEVSFGMGKSISYINASSREDLDELRKSDPEVRRRVEFILASELERAKEIVRDLSETVHDVASTLMEREFLAGEELRKIIGIRDRRKRG